MDLFADLAGKKRGRAALADRDVRELVLVEMTFREVTDRLVLKQDATRFAVVEMAAAQNRLGLLRIPRH